MQTVIEYPFFTRFGTFQLTAWLSDGVTCDVLMPVAYYQAAHINWTRQSPNSRQPNWSGDEIMEVLITREEFMAAYHAAEVFLATAELEFLAPVAVVPCSNEQAKEITRLASHPLLNTRIKTRAILAISKLTKTEAAEYIDMLVASIAVLENYVDYGPFGGVVAVKVA